ncbi:MAG: ferrous iron transport protein A [Microlunatus sp.]|nr:ferrous iron transport protein A [Microlunatus sp.]
MSTRLGQRVIEAYDVTEPGSPINLSELAPGRIGTVLSVRDDSGSTTSRRLFDLGFAPGAAVKVVRRAPLADPVIFRVAGYEVALRRVHARLIDVAPAP